MSAKPRKRTTAPRSNGKPNARPPVEPDSRPPAIELAKLAAIIAPNAQRGRAMTAAMSRAMEFYQEAVAFVGELPNDTDALSARFGSDDRYWSQKAKRLESAFEAARKADRATALELDPALPDDTARAFLRAKKFPMKGHDSVLRSIRDWYVEWRKRIFNPTAPSADGLISTFEEQGDQGTRYLIPRWIMNELVSWKAQKRRTDKLRSYHRSSAQKHAVK